MRKDTINISSDSSIKLHIDEKILTKLLISYEPCQVQVVNNQRMYISPSIRNDYACSSAFLVYPNEKMEITITNAGYYKNFEPIHDMKLKRIIHDSLKTKNYIIYDHTRLQKSSK